MTDSAKHVHNHTGSTSSSSTEHTHPLPWEVLQREIAELEAQLARKRAQLDEWTARATTTY